MPDHPSLRDGKIALSGKQKCTTRNGATLVIAQRHNTDAGIVDRNVNTVAGDCDQRQLQDCWIYIYMHGGVHSMIYAGEVHTPAGRTMW